MAEKRSSAMAEMGQKRLSQPEFIGLLAVLFATIAFSIDAMLPALDDIAAEFTPDNPNTAQLVLTSFVAGMGIGTFFAGPISDAIGRKLAITLSFALYAAAAFAAAFSDSIEFLLIARFVQGLGSAGPRIIGVALVRDLYSGREMARITSIVMMIFIIFPAVAPFIGSIIIGFSDWHGIFFAFVVLAIVGASWLNLRQAETLPPSRRRPLRVMSLIAGAKEVLADRQVRWCIFILTLGFGQMFAILSSAEQLFSETYNREESFPLWFMGTAGLAGIGALVNAKFVVKLGMRRLAKMAYVMQTFMSGIMLPLHLFGLIPEFLAFPAFFIWLVSVFFMAGVTFGNLNALALVNMGHMAGMAASVVAAISTIGAVLIAVPVGLAYNGTVIPAMVATLFCSGLAWALMGKLNDETQS